VSVLNDRTPVENGGASVPESTAQQGDFKRHLWESFARSVRDNVAAEFAVQALRLGGLVALARLLRPDDFGLLRVLLVVSIFAMSLSDAGFPDALVQRKEISPAHEATGWWISLALAGTAACLLYVAAPAIARIMAIPKLTGAVRLLCLPVVLEGSAVTAGARLRRRLEFRALATADVIGEIAFLGTAISLLLMGYPRLSLPGGLAARLTAHALTIWGAEFYIPLVRPRLWAARDLGRFASSVLGANLILCFASNIDYLLVGRLLGTTALGYYSISWDLLRFLPLRIHRVAVRVIFPAFSRLQDDNLELSRRYRDLSTYLARVVLPFSACIAIAAPEVLRVLFGAQWPPAAAPLRLLTFGLALNGLREGMGAIYYAKNRPYLDIYIHLSRLIMIVVTVVGLAGFGLLAVSAGMSVLEGLVTVAALYFVCSLIALKARDLLISFMPGVRTALWCTLAALAGKGIALLAGPAGLAGPLVLAVIAIPPALVFVSLELPQLHQLLGYAFGHSPAPANEA
jgi:O-antigen/teichoic acid export membrane protein